MTRRRSAAPTRSALTLAAGNEAPVANAGPDQEVASEATVELDGSGSTDPNNDPLTYKWSQLSGPAVTLEGASTGEADLQSAGWAGDAGIRTGSL